MGADVRETVIQVLAGHLGLPKQRILTGAQFAELGVDSLELCEIVMTVEEHFDLEISKADASSLTTLADLIDYVAEAKG